MNPNKPKKPDNQLRVCRVIRGGGWYNSDAAWVRAAHRFVYAPSVRGSVAGFRTTLAGRQPRV
jgi:formylglycine-generating enzyme required for sulfatase activity